MEHHMVKWQLHTQQFIRLGNYREWVAADFLEEKWSSFFLIDQMKITWTLWVAFYDRLSGIFWLDWCYQFPALKVKGQVGCWDTRVCIGFSIAWQLPIAILHIWAELQSSLLHLFQFIFFVYKTAIGIRQDTEWLILFSIQEKGDVKKRNYLRLKI
jgi:hypothetical protein